MKINKEIGCAERSRCILTCFIPNLVEHNIPLSALSVAETEPFAWIMQSYPLTLCPLV